MISIQEWYNIINSDIQPLKDIFDRYYDGKGIVLDVGGNVGAFTDHVITKYPKTKVHLFEPVPKFTKYLIEKYTSANVKVVPKACSNITGTCKIRCDETNLGWNEISTEGYEIQTLKLDDYVYQNIKSRISFVKIDTEFYEPFVLDGMKDYITLTKNLPIITIEHNYDKSPYKDVQDRVFSWLFDYYELFDYKSFNHTEDIVLKPKKH